MPIIQKVFPDAGLLPIEAKVVEALALKTELALSKLRLFKAGGTIIEAMTTKAALEAAECDFDGYPAGGATITAWGDPFTDEDQESVILPAPSVQFNYVDAAAVANDVGGWFLVDAAGDLRGVGEFDEAITMDDDLDAIVLQLSRKF